MNIFETSARLLHNRSFWGPFLILIGAYLVFAGGLQRGEGAHVQLGLGILLVVSGLTVMFILLRSSGQISEIGVTAESPTAADYIVRQLSQNYQILRSQTSQGFFLSGVFMTLGILVIIVSLFGTSFGLQSTGVNLTVLAGILLEFISGTALLIYRINFQRLNETSDKLDEAWRILSAYKLTEQLPEEKKAEATVKLIEALSQSRKT
jgi:hypothetical protein